MRNAKNRLNSEKSEFAQKLNSESIKPGSLFSNDSDSSYQSLNLLLNVSESLGLVVFAIDGDDKILYCNDRFNELTGWSNSKLQNHSIFDNLIPFAQKEEFLKLSQDILRPDCSAKYHQFHIKTLGQVKKLFRWIIIPNSHKKSFLSEVLFIGREMAFNQKFGNLNDRIFRSIFDSVDDIMLLIDKEFNIEKINRKAEEFTSEPTVNIEGKKCYRVFAGIDSPCKNCIVNKNSVGQTSLHTTEIIQKFKNRHFMYKTSPLTDDNGKIIKYVSIVRDITDMKSAEENLIEHQTRLDLALHGADLGLWDWRIASDTVNYNYRWAEMLGYKLSDINEKIISWHKLIHPDDKERVFEKFNNLLQGRTDVFECEYRMKHKNGSWIWVLDKGKVVSRDQNNKPLRASGTHLDITNEKNYQLALRDYHEQLKNHAVHTEVVREEERKYIAAEIHDDLGHALTAIKYDISIIRNNIQKKHKNEIADSLLEISKRVDNTINKVRDISTRLRPAILDLFGIIPAIKWQAEDFERTTGIKCEFLREPKDVLMDNYLSTAVFRIFQESLTNVARHADATKIVIDIIYSDSHLDMKIIDDGKGFVFDDKIKIKSYGLFAMTERANSLGGTLIINTEPGKGTAVHLNMPYNAH